MRTNYLQELYRKSRNIRRKASHALRELRRSKRSVQRIPRETDEEIRAAILADLGNPAFD